MINDNFKYGLIIYFTYKKVQVVKMANMWMVRITENNLINLFMESNCISIGLDVQDLSGKTSDDIKFILSDQYSDSDENILGNNPKQVTKFVSDFEIGDYVVSFDSEKDKYLVGRIYSEYYYSDKLSNGCDDDSYCHIRDVEWIGEVEHNNLKEATLRHLHSSMFI